MVRIELNICLPEQSTMEESIAKNTTRSSDTLQDIAFNILEDKSSQPNNRDNATKERTIFVLGSKGVVSTFAWRNFFQSSL